MIGDRISRDVGDRRMARNLVAVSDEFQVNLLDPIPRKPPQTENGIVGTQLFPEIAVLDNGNFVVV